MSINITALSISKINETPLKIKIGKNEYPMAPLVFAENSDKANCFRVRIVVYIPSEVNLDPVLTVEEKPFKVTTPSRKQLTARHFIVDYDHVYTVVPDKYTLWNINIEYELKDLESLEFVVAHLRHTGPKTSRGTVTTVQEAVVSGDKSLIAPQ